MSRLSISRLRTCCARLLFTWLLIGISTPAWTASYRVELEAPDALDDLLTEFLDLFRYRDREDIGIDQLNFMVATAPEQVADLAATEGYFSTNTKVNVDRSGEVPVVQLTVEAGPRTHVTKANIDVRGAAAERSPEQVEQVLEQWPLNEGDAFTQEQWAAAKQSGLQILQRRRYAAAHLAESEARIYADRQEAELTAIYDSGPVFTLGPLNITGSSRYPERIIRNINPLREGEEYSAERLLEFQRQLLRTPYYGNAVIDIEENPANANLAPVNVRVTEFPTQRVRGAVGYTTDTGAHLEGRYSHNNIFGRAWVLDAQTRVEQERQLGALELSMPPSKGAFVNSIFGSVDRTTLSGVDLQSRRLGVRRARSTDTRDTAYSLTYYRDELEQLNNAPLPPDVVIQPGAHQALVLGISKTRRKVDNQLFPRNGRIVVLEAGIAVKGVLTDQTFLRGYGQLREFIPVGQRDIVVLRAELGAVITKGGNASIPASLLFRAGGTESVRGYEFQSIGNVSNGTVFPTRYLATGGVEYQHWFREQWGGAVFYDVGAATDDWANKDLFHAVGVGVRWRSPVGRVNADLAYGFQDQRLRPHLSLGVAF